MLVSGILTRNRVQLKLFLYLTLLSNKHLSISTTAAKEAQIEPVADHTFFTNHNGDLDFSPPLIDLAKDEGSVAVKYQKRTV